MLMGQTGHGRPFFHHQKATWGRLHAGGLALERNGFAFAEADLFDAGEVWARFTMAKPGVGFGVSKLLGEYVNAKKRIKKWRQKNVKPWGLRLKVWILNDQKCGFNIRHIVV